jgi:hypothetical protein
MTLSSALGRYALSAVGNATSTGVSGSPSIGFSPVPIAYPAATVAYVARCILAAATDQAVIDLDSGDTSASDSWTAGTAQLNTATVIAAGGATSNGTMTLVLTAAGMTGSPKNIAVPLTTTAHTTAALIATAARAALAADPAVSALFTLGGTGADITLLRKSTPTFTIPGGTLSFFPANDDTLNLAIPSGLGVTAAPTSTNTIPGVATAGAYWIDGDGNDFEGVPLPTMSVLFGVLIKSNSGAFAVTTGGDEFADQMIDGQTVLRLSDGSTALSVATATFTADAVCDFTLTVLGAS